MFNASPTRSVRDSTWRWPWRLALALALALGLGVGLGVGLGAWPWRWPWRLALVWALTSGLGLGSIITERCRCVFAKRQHNTLVFLAAISAHLQKTKECYRYQSVAFK